MRLCIGDLKELLVRAVTDVEQSAEEDGQDGDIELAEVEYELAKKINKVITELQELNSGADLVSLVVSMNNGAVKRDWLVDAALFRDTVVSGLERSNMTIERQLRERIERRDKINCALDQMRYIKVDEISKEESEEE